jgi:hypothetical protein
MLRAKPAVDPTKMGLQEKEERRPRQADKRRDKLCARNPNSAGSVWERWMMDFFRLTEAAY